MSDARPTTYILELRSLPESWRPEPWMRLRAAVKVLKRGYGFQVIRCAEKKEPEKKIENLVCVEEVENYNACVKRAKGENAEGHPAD